MTKVRSMPRARKSTSEGASRRGGAELSSSQRGVVSVALARRAVEGRARLCEDCLVLGAGLDPGRDVGRATPDVLRAGLALSRQRGVHLQVAANVLQANGRRKLALLGLLDLP